jgi:hypothetical protein
MGKKSQYPDFTEAQIMLFQEHYLHNGEKGLAKIIPETEEFSDSSVKNRLRYIGVKLLLSQDIRSTINSININSGKKNLYKLKYLLDREELDKIHEHFCVHGIKGISQVIPKFGDLPDIRVYQWLKRNKLLVKLPENIRRYIQSENMKKNWRDRTYHEVMIKVLNNPEVRKRKSESAKKIWTTEYREKIQSIINTKEYKDKKSKAAKKMWERSKSKNMRIACRHRRAKFK